MDIVKYKVFGSVEDFVKWQVEYKIDGPRKILQIAPILGGIKNGGNAAYEGTNLETSLSVFVTYWENVDISTEEEQE